MTLKTALASDIASVFLNTDEFAETVTYTTAAGVASSISAVVDRQTSIRDEEETGSRGHETALVSVATSDVPSVTVAGDTVTIGSNLFTVAQIINRDADMLTLGCERVFTNERSK